jgi:NADH-quinone oxidoreductase subunit J
MSIFYFVAFLSIFFALMTVFTKNPVHSVLYLVITFFTFTVHYILLNAQFLAAVNFIVYMGAIMVLFLFVLMLLNLNKDTEPLKSNLAKPLGQVLFNEFLLPFEISSILLLTAMIGAVLLAKKDPKKV